MLWLTFSSLRFVEAFWPSAPRKVGLNNSMGVNLCQCHCSLGIPSGRRVIPVINDRALQGGPKAARRLARLVHPSFIYMDPWEQNVEHRCHASLNAPVPKVLLLLSARAPLQFEVAVKEQGEAACSFLEAILGECFFEFNSLTRIMVKNARFVSVSRPGHAMLLAPFLGASQLPQATLLIRLLKRAAKLNEAPQESARTRVPSALGP